MQPNITVTQVDQTSRSKKDEKLKIKSIESFKCTFNSFWQSLQAKQLIPVITTTSLAQPYTYVTEIWASLLIVKLVHLVDFFKNGEKSNCDDI